MRIEKSRTVGFTLVEIMIVVAIIGLLGAIAIPNFVKARTTSQMNACINNLRQIDGAVQQWAVENKAAPTSKVVLTDITPYLGRGSSGSTGNLYCPADTAQAFAIPTPLRNRCLSKVMSHCYSKSCSGERLEAGT